VAEVRDDSPQATSKPMRIAMVAPPWLQIPPEGYGGIETICADLTDGLVARGHEVHLFASGIDGTEANFVRSYEDPPIAQIGEAGPEVTHAARVAAALEDIEVDIVHDHSFAGPLLGRGRRAPTVATVHGPLVEELDTYYRLLGRSVHLVAISDAQRRSDPDLHWTATVYNAIRVHDYPFRAGKDDYALFLGRMNLDKGAHIAIDVARKAGWRLLIAAKLNEPAEQAYFDEEIKPRLGDDVEWLGEANGERKSELLSGARCLLFPLQWEEPFGLVMIEAMACGTPVVALRRGSVPEIVTDGVTGVLRDDPADLPAALDAVAGIDPRACRERAENEFDLPVMVSRYEEVYRNLLAKATGE
jgi:glycosyltransferase involved in cell wall biosynthesis